MNYKSYSHIFFNNRYLFIICLPLNEASNHCQQFCKCALHLHSKSARRWPFCYISHAKSISIQIATTTNIRKHITQIDKQEPILIGTLFSSSILEFIFKFSTYFVNSSQVDINIDHLKSSNMDHFRSDVYFLYFSCSYNQKKVTKSSLLVRK